MRFLIFVFIVFNCFPYFVIASLVIVLYCFLLSSILFIVFYIVFDCFSGFVWFGMVLSVFVSFGFVYRSCMFLDGVQTRIT